MTPPQGRKELPRVTDRQGTIKPPKAAPGNPLEEGMRGRRPKRSVRRHSTGNFGILKYTQRNIETDFAVADALGRVGRKVNDDYTGIGEYIGSIGEEFQRMERCRVYMALRQKISDTKLTSLERRSEVWRDKTEWCIDEAPGQIILPPNDIFEVFTDRTPTIVDGSIPLKLVFGNMHIDDDKCEVKDRGILGKGKSVAMMPFYYRYLEHASGIVVFEGDLRCKDSEVTDEFSQAYWSARLAMGMAAQISSQLTHRIDDKTNLTRYRDFQVDIRHGIEGAVEGGNEICLLLIDLDDFKGINDRYGYRGGDAVLSEVGEAIMSSVRSDDIASRLGGDEFAVLVKNVSWGGAMGIAERILDNISNLSVPHNGSAIDVTCSMGMVDVKKVAQRMFAGIPSLSEGQIEEVYTCAFEESNGQLLMAKHGGKAQISSA